MSTRDLYTTQPDQPGWAVEMAGDARFTWEYDEPRQRLLDLYAKGKDKQWDAVKRIDWGLEVDPYDVLGVKPTASTEEIDSVYKQKACFAHPDVVGGSTEAMQRLNEARRKLKGAA